ncbi:MAG: sulfatase family protein [Rubripirellula sp.]
MNFLRPFLCALASITLVCASLSAQSPAKPNLLIVTVDDMSADSLGAFGCPLPETSPSIDAFARQALRFKHAHVQVGNCMPGRNIMWSGMFSHANGVEGFVQNVSPDYPVLCDLAKQAGYFAAIRGKASHSTPYYPYAWDAVLDTDPSGQKYPVKDAKGYGTSTREGIRLAKQADKPFCLLINISDPHKPFYAQGKSGETIADLHVPSRVFTSDEVPVPGFLLDDDVVRKELAHYYSSVRRADDCFREIMSALDESDQAESTFVMFLSDHGMPLPFAKTQLYHHSTHTPLMVRWPGVTQPGSVDQQHMVSAIDFIPTLLDVMGHEHPAVERLHGRSFASVLGGQSQSDRDHVILQYNENSGRARHPMRGIHTRKYLYLYNPWSDGQRKFATATTGTMTYRQMVKRATNETEVALRLAMFDHRVVEELYDIENDPDCLENLIGDPDQQDRLRQLRTVLANELVRVEDPLAPLLAQVDDVELRGSFMAGEDERSRLAREAKQKRNKSTAQRSRQRRGLITLSLPESVHKGESCRVVVHHQLPKNLGKQKVHVTLKQVAAESEPKADARLQREVVTVEGKGDVTVTFDVPVTLNAKAVRVAAFVGEDYSSSVQHLNSKPVAVD